MKSFKNYPYLISPFDKTTKNMIFCPERDHICHIGQIGKGRETLLHGVYGCTVKKLTLTFGPQIFSWLPNIYRDSQKNWEKNPMLIFSGWPRKLGHPSIETLKKSPKCDVSLNFAPGGPPMANLDMEPLDIMGDWYQVERKPTLKPPVVEILIFTEKNTDVSN